MSPIPALYEAPVKQQPMPQQPEPESPCVQDDEHLLHEDEDDEAIDGDEEEQSVLQAYARSSDAIVAKSVERYVGFVRRRKRAVDPVRWAFIKQERGLSVYKECVELRTMKSFVSTIGDDEDYYAAIADEEQCEPVKQHEDGKRAADSGRMNSGLQREGSYVECPSTMVSAFCIGQLRGSLETVMAGLYADSTDDMRSNCAVQFGDDSLKDCGVVQTFESEDDEHPFRFFGVKWLEKQSLTAGLIDQLCYVERMGVHTIKSGRRFGYQLLKSMHLDDVNADPRREDGAVARPVNVSLCYLYCQIDADVVEVFVRGIVEIVSDVRDQEAAVHAAADYILAAVRGRECGRMRKISQLIGQSKTERDRLTACHCSTVIPGLPKVEMCTSCQQAMLRPKLVDVRELMRATKAKVKKGDSASELLIAELAANKRDQQQQQLLLQSRYGTLRRDAELPETLRSYRESQSFRMFLPIRDPRPGSGYRVARKEKGNVLMQMLRRNQHRSTFLPEFLRPTSDAEDDHHGIAAGSDAHSAAVHSVATRSRGAGPSAASSG